MLNLHTELANPIWVEKIKEMQPIEELALGTFSGECRSKEVIGSISAGIGMKEACYITIIVSALKIADVQSLIEMAHGIGINLPMRKSKRNKEEIGRAIMTRYDTPALRERMNEQAIQFYREHISDDLLERVDDIMDRITRPSYRRKLPIAFIYSVLSGNISVAKRIYEWVEKQQEENIIDMLIVSSYRAISISLFSGMDASYASVLSQLEEQKILNQKLKDELAEERREKAQLIQENIKLNNTLENKTEILEKKEKLVLDGVKILVFGHIAKRDHYRDVIEKYGAQFRFMAAEKKEGGMSKIQGYSRWADYVVFVGSYASHSIYLKLLSEVNNEKVVTINKAGTDSLEKEIISSIIPMVLSEGGAKNESRIN